MAIYQHANVTHRHARRHWPRTACRSAMTVTRQRLSHQRTPVFGVQAVKHLHNNNVHACVCVLYFVFVRLNIKMRFDLWTVHIYNIISSCDIRIVLCVRFWFAHTWYLVTKSSWRNTNSICHEYHTYNIIILYYCEQLYNIIQPIVIVVIVITTVREPEMYRKEP